MSGRLVGINKMVMKRTLLLLLMFLVSHFCYSQRYTLTSYMYIISKAPNYAKKERVRQYSTIIVDLNKLTIDLYRKDRSFSFKILEMDYGVNGGRRFKCMDITGGRNVICWVSYSDMSALVDRKEYQMHFTYDNLNAFYLISGD
jgi:hypothetical protein